MMHDVEIPEKSRLVADAVKPVITKIIGKKQNQPRPPGIHRHLKRRVFVNPEIGQTVEQTENKTETDAPETERDIRPGIFPVDFRLILPVDQPRLYGDQQRENRN